MYNSDPPSNPLHAWQHWAVRMEQRIQEQQHTIERLEQELQRIKQQLAKQDHSSPIYHVEKIEYHFDQLKVDTLEGSLQIGLSTSNPEQLPMMIEDFVMQQQNPNAAAPFPAYGNGDLSANPPYKRATSQPAPYVAKPNPRLKNRLQKHDATDTLDSSDGQPPFASREEQTLNHDHHMKECVEQLKLSLQQRFYGYIDRQSSLLQLDVNEDHKKLIIEDLDRQLPARVHYYYEEQWNKNKGVELEAHKQHIIRLTLDDIESAIDQYLYQLTQENKE